LAALVEVEDEVVDVVGVEAVVEEIEVAIRF